MAVNHDQIDPALLAQLLAEQYAQRGRSALPAPQAAQSTPTPRRRRATSSSYTTVLYKAAVLVALFIMLGVWYAGAHFTLAAIASWGLDVASWGLIAWLIPLGVTCLEVGTVAGRARLPALWIVWAAVLAFDVGSTAVGLLNVTDGWHVLGHVVTPADPTSIAIGGIIGLVIAYGSEPAIKGLVKELFH